MKDHNADHDNWDGLMNSKFFILFQLLCHKFSYALKHLTNDFGIMNDTYGYFVVMLKSTNNFAMCHVVSIADGYIIDGLFMNMVELTELNLDKICGHVDKAESPKFDGILAGYEVMPPVTVKQRINSIGSWCEPKEKAYFQKSVEDDDLDGDE